MTQPTAKKRTRIFLALMGLAGGCKSPAGFRDMEVPLDTYKLYLVPDASDGIGDIVAELPNGTRNTVAKLTLPADSISRANNPALANVKHEREYRLSAMVSSDNLSLPMDAATVGKFDLELSRKVSIEAKGNAKERIELMDATGRGELVRQALKNKVRDPLSSYYLVYDVIKATDIEYTLERNSINDATLDLLRGLGVNLSVGKPEDTERLHLPVEASPNPLRMYYKEIPIKPEWWPPTTEETIKKRLEGDAQALREILNSAAKGFAGVISQEASVNSYNFVSIRSPMHFNVGRVDTSSEGARIWRAESEPLPIADAEQTFALLSGCIEALALSDRLIERRELVALGFLNLENEGKTMSHRRLRAVTKTDQLDGPVYWELMLAPQRPNEGDILWRLSLELSVPLDSLFSGA